MESIDFGRSRLALRRARRVLQSGSESFEVSIVLGLLLSRSPAFSTGFNFDRLQASRSFSTAIASPERLQCQQLHF